MRAFIAAGAKGTGVGRLRARHAAAADLAAMTGRSAGASWSCNPRAPARAESIAAKKLADAGVLAADNLNPQKARLLLALALTRPPTQPRSRASSPPTEGARKTRRDERAARIGNGGVAMRHDRCPDDPSAEAIQVLSAMDGAHGCAQAGKHA